MQSKKIMSEQQYRAQRRCIKGVVAVAVFCDANNGGASNRAANQSKQAWSLPLRMRHAASVEPSILLLFTNSKAAQCKGT